MQVVICTPLHSFAMTVNWPCILYSFPDTKIRMVEIIMFGQLPVKNYAASRMEVAGIGWQLFQQIYLVGYA